MDNEKPLALVTGASSGIGMGIAARLAVRAGSISWSAPRTGASPRPRPPSAAPAPTSRRVRADLRRPEEFDELWSAVADGGRPVSLAVLNAGVGQGGRFVDTDLDDSRSVIDLNVTSTVHPAKLVLRDMVARGEGDVLVSSSIAATMPGTYQAIYNASKAFLQSFAMAVRAELDGTGVSVTSLMPGPTETDFFHRADRDDTPVGAGNKDDAGQVAEQAVAAVLARREKVVAGSLGTKAQGAANDVLPDAAKAAVHGRMAEPGGAV